MKTWGRAVAVALRVLAASSSLLAAAPAHTHFNPEDLFASPEIVFVTMSPTGDWAAALAWGEKLNRVLVQRRGAGAPEPIYAAAAAEILQLVWVGNDTLLIGYGPDRNPCAFAVRLRFENGEIVSDRLRLWKNGVLVAPLPQRDDSVLWAVEEKSGSAVYRGPLEALANGDRWRVSRIEAQGGLERVAHLSKRVVHWVADSRGDVRAALAVVGGNDPVVALLFRDEPGDDWTEVWRESESDPILHPLAFTEDGRRLIALSYAAGDKIGIYEFDPDSGEIGRQLFSRPDVDVIGASFDEWQPELIAAISDAGGLRQYHYTDHYRQKYLEDIVRVAPGQSVAVTSSSRDHRFFSLFVHGPRNPGSFLLFDKQQNRQEKFGAVLPGVPEQELADVEVLDVPGPNGTHLEAYFARPLEHDGSSPPLLVMPHGGPIDVRDDRSFDPTLQFMASYGIAVLKVNYRGSGGFGRAFAESGKREWARGIEDDIDAAVDHVIGRGLVDPKRICIAGASYGGYSALVSAIRRPDRYRCAASLNGPTDLPLLLQSSEIAWTEEGRRALIEIVGDPHTDLEHLVEISPVYQAHRIQVPVLIAFGTEDLRVDPEHAYRLRAMLELHAKRFQWVELPGAGHSPNREQYVRFARYLRDFVRAELGRDSSGPERGALGDERSSATAGRETGSRATP